LLKVELEIEDLKTTIDGLNNAYVALNDIRTGIFLGLEIPEKFKFLEGTSFDDLTEKIDPRLKAVRDLYNQLLKYE